MKERSLRTLEHKYSGKAAGELSEVMQRARSSMAPALREHTPLIFQVFNLINIAGMAASNGKTSDSKYVCANLLARIARDLLALASLARDGLADQTCVIAASTYECAVTIGAIGDDDSEAARWLVHADLTRSVDTVKESSVRTEKALNLEIELYKFYRSLCAPKHSNPVSQKHSGRDECREHALCNAQYFFPTGSTRDQFEAGVAIEIALMMANLALLSFINNHIELRVKSEFLEQLSELENAVNKLLIKRADTAPEHCRTTN